jgi:hypothetical protein
MNTPMDDENLARQAFMAAFRSGSTGEPPVLPDVEALVNRGRRASRQRHGVYAAGTTALAGVVTAGVVTAPTLLGIGSTSPSGISVGAGTTAAQTASKPTDTLDPKKPAGVACTTPPAVDWTAVVAAALPASIHALADHAANCLTFPDGSRRIDAGFTLSVPAGTLQIDIQSGGQLASKLADADQLRDPTSPPPLDPSAVASIQALKSKMAEDASTRASMDAIKASMAATDDAAARAAKESEAANNSSAASNTIDKSAPSCHAVGANLTACVTTVTKGGYVGTDVQLIRTGADPLVIDVIAASGADAPSPAPGAKAPMDADQVTAIAQAVSAHL